MTNQKITAATPDARFIANDGDMLEAERRYQMFEQDLRARIDNAEKSHPGYDKYVYDIAPIGHDPYVLIAILCAKKPNFRMADPEICTLMNTLMEPRRQYTLTMEPDKAGGFKVRLTNYELNCVADSILSYDELCRYATYLRSHGNRPDLFPQSQYPNVTPIQHNTIPSIDANSLTEYPALQKMLDIGNRYINYPYVWGGSDPSTSFDCSGFIDYILDQLGYNFRNIIDGKVVRLPVAGSSRGGVFYDGIYEKCHPIAVNQQRPGDLVFFGGTFNVSYRKTKLTHVGIYIGDNTFLACNSPVGVKYSKYTDESSHPGKSWGDLLFGYGRLPKVEGDGHE